MNARATLAIVALLAGAAAAQDAPPTDAAPAPDTSGWSCRFCLADDGTQGWLEPGAWAGSSDSYHFGDYTGLHERGGGPDLAGGWRWRDAETGRALDAHAERLGLDSRAFGVGVGEQGRWRGSIEYSEVPHYVAADGVSPFRGGSTLDLPAGWVTGGSTGAMPQLDASLRGVSLDLQRERSVLALGFVPHPLADARFGYRRDRIRGTALTGASLLTQASQLPRAVDHTLDRFDAALGVRHPRVNAQVEFESSFYSSGARALTWDNPYNPPAPGATAGRMAQAPDNSAHRLTFTAGTPPAAPLQASGQLSLGRLLQDDRFLPATINPDEAAALPRDSLGARVDTLLAAVRASWTFGRALRLSADVLRDDRDTKTPVDAYTQVVMDTYTGAARTNAPYGFTRNRWRFSAERRASPRLGVGIDDDRRERRLYGTGETVERRYWGRAGWRPFDGADLKLRVAHARREGREYSAAGGPAQNPLLRATNTAERRRQEARADFSLGGAVLSQSYHLTYAHDEYPGTQIGRTRGKEVGYGADVVVQVSDAVSLAAFAAHREQDHAQAGSQAFGAPDWLAEQEDASDVLGASLGWKAPQGIDFGLDYVFSTSEGSITMLAAASESGFPLLLTRWHDLRLHATRAFRPDLTLRIEVLHEDYQARDWGQAGLDPATVPNLLALGQGSQSGTATAVLASARYEFGGAPPAPAD